jgi:hypothetical protein
MPPFGDSLDEKQIAAVSSYIRRNWGSLFGAVNSEQVAQIRQDLASVRQQAPPPLPRRRLEAGTSSDNCGDGNLTPKCSIGQTLQRAPAPNPGTEE